MLTGGLEHARHSAALYDKLAAARKSLEPRSSGS
jgi:hypothetical protein